jgi:periplasmic protein TonB
MVAHVKLALDHRRDPEDLPVDADARPISPPSQPHRDDAQPSMRYSDRPTSLRTRLFGMGGTAVIAGLVLGGALFTWTTYRAQQAPKALSVFDVAPPAAPAEPVQETPPGPEQVQKERQQPDPDTPVVEPPEVQVPSMNVMAVRAAKPVPDPGPPVEQTTAPENKPLPPAPQLSTGKPTWEGLVLGALNKVKRYPREAGFRRQQGVPYIRFVMNREGKVLSVRLERSSGFRQLDEEALALPKRAAPLPKPSDDKPGETLELVVPVEFFLR